MAEQKTKWPENSPVLEAAQILEDSDYLLIVAGAGMGVDSDIPTFEDFRRMVDDTAREEEEGLFEYEDFSSASALDYMTPERYFGFHGWAFNKMVRDASPHAGYDVLRRWCDEMEQRRAASSRGRGGGVEGRGGGGGGGGGGGEGGREGGGRGGG